MVQREQLGRIESLRAGGDDVQGLCGPRLLHQHRPQGHHVVEQAGESAYEVEAVDKVQRRVPQIGIDQQHFPAGGGEADSQVAGRGGLPFFGVGRS